MIIQHWAKSVKFAAQHKEGPALTAGPSFYANAPIGSQGAKTVGACSQAFSVHQLINLCAQRFDKCIRPSTHRS